MSLISRIIDFLDKKGEVPLTEVYDAFKEEKPSTIRGRINEVVAKKGKILRTAKGQYMLLKDEVYALVETVDTKEALFHILKAGIYYDLCFFDPPYLTGGQKGGNRNLSAYSMICPEEFEKILLDAEKMLKDETSQVYFMIAGGVSSAAAASKYIQAFEKTSLKLAGEGSYTKLNANGTQCNMGKYLMPAERILVFSPSGQLLKPEETILDFSIQRPPLPKSGGYPTQKPVAMLEQLFRQGTHFGGKIIDFFAGSGSSLEAALNIGRKIHCLEISPTAVSEHIKRKLECFESDLMPATRKFIQPSLFSVA